FISALNLKILEAEAKLAKLNGKHFEFADGDGLKKGKVEVSEGNTAEGDEETGPADEKEPEEARNQIYDELEENLKALQDYRENNPQETEDNGTKISTDLIGTLSNNVERERMEEYLASLKATEGEDISNEKLKEQIRIINRFIENEPKLSRLELEEGPQANRIDLSLKS